MTDLPPLTDKDVIGAETLLTLCRLGVDALGGEFTVSRLDVAWDDFSKGITPGRFRKRFWDRAAKTRRPEVVCRAKSGISFEDDSAEGGSGYRIGSRK
ncbi:MAG: hypothetical protein IIB38_16050, partial [Candidatus Hydrogenedentes bacterium]|nr:hypothetical protein [Candidatus Hydrogenedentota bacterium]